MTRTVARRVRRCWGLAVLAAALLADGGGCAWAVAGMTVADPGPGAYSGSQLLITGDTAPDTAKDAKQTPSERNPLLTDAGDARASRIIGTPVYNEKGEQLGTVHDVVVGKPGIFAVLTTDKGQVEVPLDRLRFGDARANGKEKLVIPGMTRQQAQALPPAPQVPQRESRSDIVMPPADGGGRGAQTRQLK